MAGLHRVVELDGGLVYQPEPGLTSGLANRVAEIALADPRGRPVSATVESPRGGAVTVFARRRRSGDGVQLTVSIEGKTYALDDISYDFTLTHRRS